eukprot:gb/GECG01014527.1/.p1 GENE.gb/GECG01014527.1/~~gb/GECG01014527.1/.p1  ORF type:complete len:100 (+),score=8.39 gb/GECG01014527.1/:1-300(+)
MGFVPKPQTGADTQKCGWPFQYSCDWSVVFKNTFSVRICNFRYEVSCPSGDNERIVLSVLVDRMSTKENTRTAPQERAPQTLWAVTVHPESTTMAEKMR